MQNIIDEFIGGLKLGRKQSYRNLTVFALLSDYATNLNYLTLDEALSGNLIEVVEKNEGGTVPELKVVNRSDRMVLILDGEELVGAKQNRIVNTTILIAGNTTTVIPVSCVEQGRWSYKSDKFSSEKRMLSGSLRSKKADQVKYSLKNLGNFSSNQAEIWEDVSELASDLNAESPSMAMSEIYRKEAPSIQKYVKHFDLTDSQIGAVFMINGKVAGMDCFGKLETFSKVFKKLLESYALDAIDSFEKGQAFKVTKNEAAKFLEASAECRVEAHQSVGLGTDCRLDSDGSTGFALAHKKQVLHMSLFAKAAENNRQTPGSRMIRFSHRRRRRF
jgi:flavodoxin